MKHSQYQKWEDLWKNDTHCDDTGYSLYVSNLSPSVTARDLKKLFEKIGSLISVNVILDPESGESRGYGFIDYESLDCREKARRHLHGERLCGTKIRVSRSCGKCTLYVGNLPPFINDIVNDNQVRSVICDKLFEISSIPIRRIRKRRNYNYGFVEYDNHRQAQAALISLRNAIWNEYELRVEIAASDLEQPPAKPLRSASPASPRPPPPPNNEEKRKTLYIKNIDKATSDSLFKKVFEKYGKLIRCVIIRDVPSRKLNYGFVQYESVEAADKAYYNINNTKLDGITLQIEISKSLPGERKKRLLIQNHNRNNGNKSRYIQNNPLNKKYDERNKNLHFRSSASDSSSISSSSSSPSPLSSSSGRSRSRSRSRARNKNNIPTTTINNNNNNNNNKQTLCVNLPNEYSMKQMKHLIGFDTNQQRYILFKVNTTSSSLTKLQSFLSHSPSTSPSPKRKSNARHRHQHRHQHQHRHRPRHQHQHEYRHRDRHRDGDRDRHRGRGRVRRRRGDSERNKSRSMLSSKSKSVSPSLSKPNNNTNDNDNNNNDIDIDDIKKQENDTNAQIQKQADKQIM